jgi:hypothetical protein
MGHFLTPGRLSGCSKTLLDGVAQYQDSYNSFPKLEGNVMYNLKNTAYLFQAFCRTKVVLCCVLLCGLSLSFLGVCINNFLSTKQL